MTIRRFPLPMPPTARDCQQWSDAIVRAYGFPPVDERDFMPAGVLACCDMKTLKITAQRFTEALSTAVLLARVGSRAHEFGHAIAGPCPNTGPHYRDPKERRWCNCVQCETVATEIAPRLVLMPSEMFRPLKSSLNWYRRETAAPQYAVTAAKRVASDSYWAASVMAHAERDRREDQMREMTAAAEDARRRPLTRAEIHERTRRELRAEGIL